MLIAKKFLPKLEEVDVVQTKEKQYTFMKLWLYRVQH